MGRSARRRRQRHHRTTQKKRERDAPACSRLFFCSSSLLPLPLFRRLSFSAISPAGYYFTPLFTLAVPAICDCRFARVIACQEEHGARGTTSPAPAASLNWNCLLEQEIEIKTISALSAPETLVSRDAHWFFFGRRANFHHCRSNIQQLQAEIVTQNFLFNPFGIIDSCGK